MSVYDSWRQACLVDPSADARVRPFAAAAFGCIAKILNAEQSALGMSDIRRRVSTSLQDRFERLLGPCLRRPRYLQLVVAIVGALLIVWSAIRQPGTVRVASPSTASIPAGNTEQPSGTMTAARPLDVVAAYNAASITAGMTGRMDAMEPMLVPNGPAWQLVAQEFARRAQRNEVHQPTLVRWGAVSQALTATEAVVETQEARDDQTLVGGVLVDAQRGLLQRVRYSLTRTDVSQPWRIDSVESQLITR